MAIRLPWQEVSPATPARSHPLARLLAAVAWSLAASASAEGPGSRIPLASDWSLQSSAKVADKGEALSRPGFATQGWYPVTVPNTVVGALVENGTYPDPVLRHEPAQDPGDELPDRRALHAAADARRTARSPSWWYRTEFELPPSAGRTQRSGCTSTGINYRANIWLNGKQIADEREIVGRLPPLRARRDRGAAPGRANALAVEVFGPEPDDLAITWVDWNPTPADKNMGLWGDGLADRQRPGGAAQPARGHEAGPALARHRALTVTAEVWNATDRAVKATRASGAIEDIRFSPAGGAGAAGAEDRALRARSGARAASSRNPRLWWPYRMGEPEPLHAVPRRRGGRRGLRPPGAALRHPQMSSELTGKGHRLFRVNGKPILIRGGGWASDMLLRPASRERLEAELRYVSEMGLNTIRLEGKLESDLVLRPRRPRGDPGDARLVLLRPLGEVGQVGRGGPPGGAGVAARPDPAPAQPSRACFVWLNGSDFPPPAKVEQAYLDVLEELRLAEPVLSNATDTPGPLSGPSGVKMRGPYDYVPPSYWLTDTKRGGAFGFATEIGPGGGGAADREPEQMLPADQLWPINEFWTFHAGGDEFKDLKLFTAGAGGALRQGRRAPRTTRARRRPSPTRASARCSRPSAATSTRPPASSSGCSTTPGPR